MNQGLQIFISYSKSESSRVANDLYRHLHERLGYYVFLDKEETSVLEFDYQSFPASNAFLCSLDQLFIDELTNEIERRTHIVNNINWGSRSSGTFDYANGLADGQYEYVVIGIGENNIASNATSEFFVIGGG